MSSPPPPVGRYEPLAVIAFRVMCASEVPGTARKSCRVPRAAGKPGMTMRVPGAPDTGSQAPACPERVSRTAATTCPTLVRTRRATTRVPCSILSRDWRTMLCGATAMPVSVLPCSGPASVNAWTVASAGCPLTFIRKTWMCGAVKTPGPTNQKSVPGPAQRAAARPLSLTCSASSPRAIAPVAWITVPPGAGTVATGGLVGAGLCVVVCAGAGFLPRAGAGTGRTAVTDSVPGWVLLAKGGPTAAGPSLVTSARPDPVEDGPAISATWAVGSPVRPGAGQARSTVLTGSARGCGCGALAASVTVCFHTASPAATATATTSTVSETARFAIALLTSQHLPGRRAPRGPGRARQVRPAGRAGGRGTATVAAAPAPRRRRPGRHAAAGPGRPDRRSLAGSPLAW